MISASLVVKVTFSGTLSPPEPPLALKIPPVNTEVRMFRPNPPGSEEMMISPKTPPFSSPTWGVELVKPGARKVSKAGSAVPAGIDTFPICVIVIGIGNPPGFVNPMREWCLRLRRLADQARQHIPRQGCTTKAVPRLEAS